MLGTTEDFKEPWTDAEEQVFLVDLSDKPSKALIGGGSLASSLLRAGRVKRGQVIRDKTQGERFSLTKSQ